MPLAIVITLLFSMTIPIQVLSFEGLLQAAGEVRKDRAAVPLRFALPDWTIYHRTDDIYSRLATTVASCKSASHLIVRSPSLSEPAQHFRADQIRSSDVDTDSLHYITISQRSSPTELAGRFIRRRRKTRSMFVFGETGRDFLTSEIALRVVEAACLPNSSRVHPNALSNIDVILVPVANPTGRRIAEMGRRCERTNANDVDLDRNWPLHWNESTQVRTPERHHTHRVSAIRHAEHAFGISLPHQGLLRKDVGHPTEEQKHDAEPENTSVVPYPMGTHPFSEAETRSLRAIVDKFQPVSYVSLRTGAVGLTIPGDCHPEDVLKDDQSRLLRIAEGILASHCSNCERGSLWNVTGSTKCGTAADYMHSIQIPFIHTWHVYNSLKAEKGDCFRKHNPTSKEAFGRIADNWAQAVFNFSTAVHNWMVLESSVGLDSAEQNASLSAAEAIARRADSTARGLREPENPEEYEHLPGDYKPRPWKRMSKDMKESSQSSSSTRSRIFSWMFAEKDIDSVAEAFEGDGAHSASQNNRHSDPEDVGLRPMTGLLGALMALMLLCCGITGVRRFIFTTPSKRSLFRSRRAEKNA